MKTRIPLLIIVAITVLRGAASAHSWKAGEAPVFDEAYRAHVLEEWEQHQRERQSATPELVADGVTPRIGKAPAQAAPFVAFAPKVEVKWDDRFLYIESSGLPAHNMMVGITAWQQQVPLPQPYRGDNAWRIPLRPVPAKTPAVVKDRFLRGAIAIAVNGVPIFNPQNNRGEYSHEIGELDQWGGHCGRADDYHYHIAPLHLQTAVGKGMPIAYALDGYAIYGLTEPDGSPVGMLDECHGHDDAKIGYHYHASTKRPYVQSAFRGEVVEADGQVDPQPRAQGVRPDTPPLRGAKITAFESPGADSYRLTYTVDGETRSVSYGIMADGTYSFTYDNGRDGVVNDVYTARRGGGGGAPRGPGGEGGKGKGKGGKGGEMRRGEGPPPLSAAPARVEPAYEGIIDSNGDGVVSAQEFADAAKRRFEQQPGGGALADALARARTRFQEMDRDRSGRLEGSEWQGGGTPAPAVARDDAPRGNPPPGEEPRERGRGGAGGGRGKQEFVASPDQPRSSDGNFLLTSPIVEDMAEMPVEFTGDGSSATLPLEWKGAPAGTQSFALIMDHTDPQGEKKWYWTVYDIPAATTGLPKNAQGVGKVGTGFKGQIGYEPPHSKGPGAKTYVLTVYALSAALNLAQTPREVNRGVLLAAMKDKVLASSSLRVVYTSMGGEGPGSGGERPRPQAAMNDQPPPQGGIMPPAGPGGLRPLDNIFDPPAQIGGTTVAQNTPRPDDAPPRAPGGGKGKGKGGKGGPDQSGLIKPSIADTMKLNVYADNWFMLYANGRLVAVDPIQFTPHNVVSVDFLPEYPMTIAVLAKDNADPKTGMEYGTSIGDGGFILKFGDGTVTNATWKAKNFFHGPVNGDTKNPQVKQEPLPDKWWAVDFDDSQWAKAKEYTVEDVDPKQPYFENDFEGAKFIWTDDLALDNTIIFRTKIEKPGWTPRWNTKPDLDVTGAPVR